MAEERAEQSEPPEQASFDANPPVDPSEPQVGNSKARFFVPREDEAREGQEEQQDESSGDAH